MELRQRLAESFLSKPTPPPVMIFQSVTLHIGNLDEDQFQFLRQFHEFFTYLMMALIGVHIVAAGYHHFVAKDDSTRRMLKFWQTQKN